MSELWPKSKAEFERAEMLMKAKGCPFNHGVRNPCWGDAYDCPFAVGGVNDRDCNCDIQRFRARPEVAQWAGEASNGSEGGSDPSLLQSLRGTMIDSTPYEESTCPNCTALEERIARAVEMLEGRRSYHPHDSVVDAALAALKRGIA